MRRNKREGCSSLNKYVRISELNFLCKMYQDLSTRPCTIMGAFHIHVDLAFRDVETSLLSSQKNMSSLWFNSAGHFG